MTLTSDPLSTKTRDSVLVHLCRDEEGVIVRQMDATLFLGECDRLPTDFARLGGFIIIDIKYLLSLVSQMRPKEASQAMSKEASQVKPTKAIHAISNETY